MTKKDTFDFRDSTDIKNVASQFNQGTISGYIYIHGNFSDMFFKRLLQPVDLDLDTINQSTMQVIMTFFLIKPPVSEICVIYKVFLILLSIPGTPFTTQFSSDKCYAKKSHRGVF